jgi:hypothetical protein
MSTDWIKKLRDPVTGRYVTTAPTRFKHRFAGGEVDVELNTAALRVYCSNQMRGMLKGVCEEAVVGARLRVTPGVGPGPHPHRTDTGWEHEDTGTLKSAIGYAFEEMSGASQDVALVYVDAGKAPYGLWLELGWHGPSGRFYRYPFIVPAVEHAMRNASRYVHTGDTLPYTSGKGGG